MGGDIAMYKNKLYGTGGIEKGGLFDQNVTTQIIKTMAETDATNANALLTNKKAEGYYQELLNATTEAEAATKHGEASLIQAANGKVQAAATKLAAEWNTGEYTNWKTWAEQAKAVVQLVTK